MTVTTPGAQTVRLEAPLVRVPADFRSTRTRLDLSSKNLRQPAPQAYMRAFCSWEVAQKANKWSGANLTPLA